MRAVVLLITSSNLLDCHAAERPTRWSRLRLRLHCRHSSSRPLVPSAGGWSSDNTYPRELADVDGGGLADIVGFSSAGVYTSLATAGGQFAMPTFELAAFGVDAGGWSSDNTYPRKLADVDGDGRQFVTAVNAISTSLYETTRAPAGAAEKTTQPRRMVSPFL